MIKQDISVPGASCAIWKDGPLWRDRPSATIGQLKIETAEAGTQLLEKICSDLLASGCEAVLAPMDGDTWHPYRLVLESDGSPPFLLEPVNGPHDLAVLEDAGFQILEEYVSARMPVPAAGSVAPAVSDICVTPWDGTGAAKLVGQLHAYAANSFADKLFFKPLGEAEFRAMYEPLVAMLDPRLVLFAHDGNGELVGFLFGYPDLMQGSAPSQVILKTYAASRHGVGHLLAWHFHERARDLGYRHIVHALMHATNRSLTSSRLFGSEVFRRYAVLGKRLIA